MKAGCTKESRQTFLSHAKGILPQSQFAQIKGAMQRDLRRHKKLRPDHAAVCHIWFDRAAPEEIWRVFFPNMKLERVGNPTRTTLRLRRFVASSREKPIHL